MASGPEHYREAEKDIDRANQESIADGFAAFIIARAQVHATLALAAATVDAARTTTYTPGTDAVDAYPSNDEAWNEVAS
jgi:hypothetical protein